MYMYLFDSITGHSQRLFAVQRARVTMDELVREDDSIGYNSRVSILLPTNGEKLDVVMKVCCYTHDKPLQLCQPCMQFQLIHAAMMNSSSVSSGIIAASALYMLILMCLTAI
jgi:hypothetical protein